MRVEIVTREFPPHVYGGAGVHVAELARVLANRTELVVRCFDGPRDPGLLPGGEVVGYEEIGELGAANPAVKTLGVDLRIAQDLKGADLIHSHTWYANLAGQLGSQLHGLPHVITAHSLEPLRPWKAEQLGGGYAVSSWVERSAYASADRIIAVSEGMRRDIERAYPQIDHSRIRVVHNGIDTTVWKRPSEAEIAQTATEHGIDPARPVVVFVGRITRQKGVEHLIAAAHHFDPEIQLVLCAGAPDTPEIGQRIADAVRGLQAERRGVVWIDEMLPREHLQRVIATGTVFACPSIYEPLGIVNLEAMALELPVVASAVGGIPEVVMDGETGVLVPFGAADGSSSDPVDPQAFAADFAVAINGLVSDPHKARRWGAASRRRAVESFSWDAIADQTLAVYREAITQHGQP